MITLLGGAFLTGLFGGVHCVGMCGSFAAACAGRHGAGGTVLYSAGRVTTYTILGAIAGTFGLALSGLRVFGLALSFALLVYFAGRLGELWPAVDIRLPWVQRAVKASMKSRWPGGTYVFGLANALIPCGLVYAALALPVAAGSPVDGALAMFAFGLGTVPAMVAVGFGSLGLSRFGLTARRVLAAAVLVVGGWGMFMRAPMTVDAPDAPTTEAPCPACTTES